MKKLIELSIDKNGNFSERDFVVIKDTKKGKYLGQDDNGKLIYDQIPATVWITEKGKVNISDLGRIKKHCNSFNVLFLGADGTEYYKDKLRDALISEFQSLCDSLEQRKERLQASVQKVDIELTGALQALNQVRGKLDV